jgi:hypothetical protein
MTRYASFIPMHVVEIWGNDGTWAITDMRARYCEKLRQVVQHSRNMYTELRRGNMLHRAAWCCKIVRMGEDKELSCCGWKVGKLVCGFGR